MGKRPFRVAPPCGRQSFRAGAEMHPAWGRSAAGADRAQDDRTGEKGERFLLDVRRGSAPDTRARAAYFFNPTAARMALVMDCLDVQ